MTGVSRSDGGADSRLGDRTLIIANFLCSAQNLEKRVKWSRLGETLNVFLGQLAPEMLGFVY